MATKKSTLPKPVNKAAWIRSQPADTPARDVVALAKKEGFKVTKAQVHTVRSAVRRKRASAAVSRKPEVGTPRDAGSNLESVVREIVRSEINQLFGNIKRLFNDPQ